MDHFLIRGGYVPPDKSWHIKLAFLDLIRGYYDSINFLKRYKREHHRGLSNDLESMLQTSLQWDDPQPIKSESGMWYRINWYSLEKFGIGKPFERQGTLIGRDLGDTREKLVMSLEQLEALETSQWASAYVLANYAFRGKIETVPTKKPKLQLTYDAINHWNTMVHGTAHNPRYDQNLLGQASAYLQFLQKGRMDLSDILKSMNVSDVSGLDAEWACFLIAFGLVPPDEAAKLWTSLPGHESDRIPHLVHQLTQDVVTSKDHRVVQAIALLRREDFMNGRLTIQHPECVNKSWPEFPEFYGDAHLLPAQALSRKSIKQKKYYDISSCKTTLRAPCAQLWSLR